MVWSWKNLLYCCWAANRIFCVSSRKGGFHVRIFSFINSRTKICEHVIAVAKKCGKLQQFVEWFRRSKCGTSVSALALNGAEQQKRADIGEVVNIFDENEIENPLLYLLSPNNTNHENEKAINENI